MTAPAAEESPPQLSRWEDIKSHLPHLPTTMANSFTPNASARASAPDPADRCVQCRWLWNGR